MEERKLRLAQNQNEAEPEQNLLGAAVDVVDMFDQANTNHVIDNMGSRGILLKDAISKLRKNLNSDKQRTTLDAKQAGEYFGIL